MILKTIYSQSVTVLNKLAGRDNPTGKDIWYKTVLNDAAWYTNSERSNGSSTSTATTTVITEYVKVLLPFHEEFRPYKEWRTLDNPSAYFTMSQGDYIILGVVPEEVTASNITKILQTYEPDVCKVKSAKTAHNRFNAYAQLLIEGV